MLLKVTYSFIYILGFDETGKISQIKSFMKFTTNEVSDMWDIKIKERTNSTDSIIDKKEKKISVDSSLNSTVPNIKFLMST